MLGTRIIIKMAEIFSSIKAKATLATLKNRISIKFTIIIDTIFLTRSLIPSLYPQARRYDPRLIAVRIKKSRIINT